MRARFVICLVATFFVFGNLLDLEAKEADTTTTDEAAITSAIESYTVAFNRGDANQVASHWRENGEFVTPSGDTLRGRKNIKAAFEKFFAENKDVRLEISEPSIRFLAPSVAVEDGTSRIIRPDEEPMESDYTAVHVKQGGKWKMDSVSEVDRERPSSHYEQLAALEWMIGEWVDQDEEATVETVCQWTKNRNFITRSFRVVGADGSEVEGTQVIGWDPMRKTIRSWVFDSKGGFGVGKWSRKGDRWTVRVLQVRQDGSSSSGINTLTYVDENTHTFKSAGREIDGQLQPNIPEVTVVRK